MTDTTTAARLADLRALTRIDLNVRPAARVMRTEVHDAIHDAVAAVRGLSEVVLDTMESSSGHAAGLLTTEVNYIGWSPSLHASRCHFEIEHRGHPNDRDAHAGGPVLTMRDIVDDVTAQIVDALHVQRLRAAAARLHGIREPLEIKGTEPVMLDHMVMDRAVLAMVRERVEDAHGSLDDIVHAIHQEGDDDGRDARLTDGTAYVEERVLRMPIDDADGHRPGLADDAGDDDELPGWARVTIRLLTIEIDVKPGASGIRHPATGEADRIAFDGDNLHMVGVELPETALALLVGKPMRTLVELHPLIDDRIITAVQSGHDDGVGWLRAYVEMVPAAIVDARPVDAV